MNKNKSPFKTQEKRLYYQYLGFINALNLFTQDIMGMKHFNFEAQPISYEDFQGFSLDIKVPLGKRVERFFEFYIQSHPNYTMLRKNIQVNHNKTTIGEFDFFLEEQHSQKVIHLELVYKFYIYKEHSNEIKRYHGPNNHDNLEDKLHKLATKQFPLLYNPYAKEILKELDIPKVSQELCFLGNVFVAPKTKAHFEAINPNALAGTYLNFETFLTDVSYQNKQYFIPQKEDWLIEPKYAEFWYSHTETIEKIEKYFKRNISLLVWIKNENEFEKAFVLKS